MSNPIRLESAIRQLIKQSRLAVSQAVNAELTLRYWQIGKPALPLYRTPD